MIWGYEIGYYKYKPTKKPPIECINHYPINESIIEYILQQQFVEFDFENENLKTIDGRVVVLI